MVSDSLASVCVCVWCVCGVCVCRSLRQRRVLRVWRWRFLIALLQSRRAATRNKQGSHGDDREGAGTRVWNGPRVRPHTSVESPDAPAASLSERRSDPVTPSPAGPKFSLWPPLLPLFPVAFHVSPLACGPTPVTPFPCYPLPCSLFPVTPPTTQ